MNFIHAKNQVLVQADSLPVPLLWCSSTCLQCYEMLQRAETGLLFCHAVPKVKCLANWVLIPKPCPPYLDMEEEGMQRQIRLKTKLRKKWKKKGVEGSQQKGCSTCLDNPPLFSGASPPPPPMTVSSFTLINFSLQLISLPLGKERSEPSTLGRSNLQGTQRTHQAPARPAASSRCPSCLS